MYTSFLTVTTASLHPPEPYITKQKVHPGILHYRGVGEKGVEKGGGEGQN
jgi:hypothetical protein